MPRRAGTSLGFAPELLPTLAQVRGFPAARVSVRAPLGACREFRQSSNGARPSLVLAPPSELVALTPVPRVPSWVILGDPLPILGARKRDACGSRSHFPCPAPWGYAHEMRPAAMDVSVKAPCGAGRNDGALTPPPLAQTHGGELVAPRAVSDIARTFFRTSREADK